MSNDVTMRVLRGAQAFEGSFPDEEAQRSRTTAFVLTGQPPHVVGSDTSEAAAKSIKAQVPTMQRAVLDCISRGRDGRTCDEVEVWLSMSHQTASARIRDLVKAGAIVDSGQRRPTRSGRKAAVYVVKAPAADPPKVALETEQSPWERFA